MDKEEVGDFLGSGGELGALTRAFDWSKTSLGRPETWPQSLRVTVRLVLTSRHPMFIWWGEELIQFYNDAYRETMGPERHPSALGARGRECWAEIWDIIGPQIDYVMAGKGATWHEDQLVPVTRYGRREDVWWTYSFGPIDVEGKVGGVLVVCKDVTSEHMAREALNLINEELKHRVKNTLTVLGAVATQTFRDASSKGRSRKISGSAGGVRTRARPADRCQLGGSTASRRHQHGADSLQDGRRPVHGLRPSTDRQIPAGVGAVARDPRACDQRDEVWRPRRAERPGVDCMDVRRSGIRFHLAGIGWPACVRALQRELRFAPDFPGLAGRFRRRGRGVV